MFWHVYCQNNVKPMRNISAFLFRTNLKRASQHRKVVSVRYNNLFFNCYSFCKNILKYLSRMARVSLSTAERSMFLPIRTVSDASGLWKCSIKVPFVVWELTVNNKNNNDILIHFLQRNIFNLQMHRLLVHLDTCIYFCLLFFGTRLAVYSYSHYLYKQLKMPGMLRHTVYSEY